jgi:hypothetical protein
MVDQKWNWENGNSGVGILGSWEISLRGGVEGALGCWRVGKKRVFESKGVNQDFQSVRIFAASHKSMFEVRRVVCVA